MSIGKRGNMPHGLLQMLQRAFWIGVSAFAVVLIIKCCSVTTKTTIGVTAKTVVKEMISDYGLSLFESQSNYMSYVADSIVLPELEDSNSIFKYMTSMYPIQQYAISEKMQMVIRGESIDQDKEFLEVMNLMKNDTWEMQEDRSEESKAMILEDSNDPMNGDVDYDNSIIDENDMNIIENPRDSYYEDDSTTMASTRMTINSAILEKIRTLQTSKDYLYLIRNFYIVDGLTYTTSKEFNVEKLLSKDMSIKINEDKPQVLIYHTHASEAFADSRKNKVSDTVVGVGSYLANILEDEYGISVIHDKSIYDMMGGTFDRGTKAYDYSLKGITKILKENPSIKVVIDLHRNSGDDKIITTVNDKDTAQIMLFNGLCRNANGDISYIPNPNLQDNLAFSLQVQLEAMKQYPTLMRKIYLKNYRYNQHVLPRTLLVELGNDKNTVEEAKNAMVPFAQVLYQVLSGNTVEMSDDKE